MASEYSNIPSIEPTRMLVLINSIEKGIIQDNIEYIKRLKSDFEVQKKEFLLHLSLLVYSNGNYQNILLDVPLHYANTTNRIFLSIKNEIKTDNYFDVFDVETNMQIMMHTDIPDSFFRERIC